MKRCRRGIPVIASLLILAATGLGQLTPDLSTECTGADLDASFKFMNDPPGDQAVAINFRNVSGRSCVLRGGNGAMFDDVKHGHNIWTKECRNCSPDGNQLFVAPLTLASGDTAHFLLRWKSTALEGSGPCQEAGGFNTSSSSGSYLVIAPSLLNDVCSVVKADSYLPGPFMPKHQSLDNSQKTKPLATVKLDASDSTLYAADSFSFRVTVDDPMGQLPIDKASCPLIFIRTRSESGVTAFEEISSFGKCTINSTANGVGRLITMIIRAPGLGVLNIPGHPSIQIHALAGSAQAQDIAMIASNQLDVNIVDPATMRRTWGPEVKGVAVSLALDKENYEIGEGIPLRMAVENVSATGDIRSGELPCGAGITVEVRDSAGKLISPKGEEMVCMGHGWTISYPKAKVVPILRMTLRGLGLLPDCADAYTVAATWNALSAVDGTPSGIDLSSPTSATFQPYAVVHSIPVTFRVLKQTR